MAGWKVFVIFVLACVFMAIGTVTIAVPMTQTGAQMWIWLAGTLTASIAAGTLLTLFLMYAGRDLDFKPRGGRS